MPLISAQTLNDAIKPLLSALQTVEDVYVKGYLQKLQDKIITKQNLQDYITKSVATANSYDNQIAGLQSQYNATLATFNALAVQRTTAAATLLASGQSFQQEILSKLRLDAWLDGLQAIASIATASVPNLLQIGDIFSEPCKLSHANALESAQGDPALSASASDLGQQWVLVHSGALALH